MLRIEEEGHSTRVAAKADMTVAAAIAVATAEGIMESRRGTAIDERAGLVGCVVCWFARH
jgi:tellurite resistance protein